MTEMTTHRRNWRHGGTGTLVSALANQSIAAAVPVAAVAVFAAIQSYSHIEALALAQHQSLADARMLPFSVDFLIVAGSVVVLAGYWLGWLGIAAGVIATLFANIESGLPFGPLSATVAAWPAVAFTIASFILERWLKRQAEPAAEVSAEAAPQVIPESIPEAAPAAPAQVTPEPVSSQVPEQVSRQPEITAPAKVQVRPKRKTPVRPPRISDADLKKLVRAEFDKDPSVSVIAAAQNLNRGRDRVGPLLKEVRREAGILTMERKQA